MASSRRMRQSVNFWPGYVDGLAGLLMIMLFLLLFYVLGELALSSALNNSQQEAAKQSGIIQRLLSQLSLVDDENRSLSNQATDLREEVESLIQQRTQNKVVIADLQQSLLLLEQQNTTLQNDLTDVENRRDSLQQQLLENLNILQQAEENAAALNSHNESLQNTLEERDKNLQESQSKILILQENINQSDLQATQLQQQLEQAQTTQTQQLEQIAKLSQDINALTVLRDTLQENLASRDVELTEQDRELIQARAEVEQLSKQINALNARFSELNQLLGTQSAQLKQKDLEIDELGKRLNIALASEVSRLQRYKSEFMGKMRALLAEQDSIKIVDERFVFQSEVLFPSSSAQLSDSGKQQLLPLIEILNGLMQETPEDLPWILRVDGHTDTRPINTARFPSNWELSTARAIAVVRYLIAQGIPENRLAATGFGATYPLETDNDDTAHRRNRRIELLLSQR